MDLLMNQKNSTRLIVLIPECMANNSDLAHAIYWMAEPDNLSVLYLVFVDKGENLLEVSRNMATMKALTSSNKLSVEVKIAKTGHWLDTLSKITEPNDVIICQEELTVANGFLNTMLLGNFLSRHMESPVRILSGYYHPFQSMTKKWLHELFNWIVLIAIIAVFTWLQISLDQAFRDPIAKIHIMISFCIEIGAVWAWYKIISR